MWSLATCVLASIMMSFVVAYKVPGRNVSIDDSYQVPKLTIDNYARMTENKTVFIRFFYTWDGHAIAMGRTWKRLAKDWDGHAVGMVADVDCTTDEGKALCDLQVEAPHHYPSLKYGDPAALKAYSGNRTYEALSSFAKENLKPVCSVANVDLCDADKKAQIQMYTKLSVDELNAAVETEEEKLTKADEEFKAALATYQEDYKKLLKDKDTTVASVKGGLAFMKYLLAAKSKGEKKDEL